MADENEISQPTLALTTEIDLGDDLLAESPLNSNPSAKSVGLKPTDSSELIENAKILVNEGFIEDAKKALRQVLVREPENDRARRALDEIQGQEVKKLFIEEQKHRQNFERTEIIDTEVLIRKLDEDLILKLFESDPQAKGGNHSQNEAFIKELENKLAASSLQDWIDVGIAFLEMECFTVATRLFDAVCRKALSGTHESNQILLSATSLLARTWMAAGNPYEAISSIQSVIQDNEITSADKIELFYLLGRMHESIGKSKLAQMYYQQVTEIDSHYRDIDQRLKRNAGAPKSSF